MEASSSNSSYTYGKFLAQSGLSHDEEGNMEQAYQLYMLAIETLMKAGKECDNATKYKIKVQVSTILQRAEEIDKYINKNGLKRQGVVFTAKKEDNLEKESFTFKQSLSVTGEPNLVDSSHSRYLQVVAIIAGIKQSINSEIEKKKKESSSLSPRYASYDSYSIPTLSLPTLSLPQPQLSYYNNNNNNNNNNGNSNNIGINAATPSYTPLPSHPYSLSHSDPYTPFHPSYSSHHRSASTAPLPQRYPHYSIPVSSLSSLPSYSQPDVSLQNMNPQISFSPYAFSPQQYIPVVSQPEIHMDFKEDRKFWFQMSDTGYICTSKMVLSFGAKDDHHHPERSPVDLTSFTFTEHSPEVFRKLRASVGFEDAAYLTCLTQRSLCEMRSAGKSGALFYSSYDSKILFKSVKGDEFAFLRSILEDYYSYMIKSPSSLLTLFLGLYTIHMGGSPPIHFVVMDNVFPNERIVPLSERYDLKGSTFGRSATAKERALAGVILKDIDFRSRGPLSLGSMRGYFFDQIEKDTEFLESHNIMDYSLLVGISKERGNNPTQTPLRSKSLFRLCEGGTPSPTGDVYFFGIIDILQQYNLRKKLEHSLKSMAVECPEELSCIDPPRYGCRFNRFVRDNVI